MEKRSVASTEEALAALGKVAQEYEDIDPNEWLSQDEPTKVEYALVGNKRVKVASITEAELQNLMRQSRRPDPSNPRGPAKLDAAKMRHALIAYSLGKASGTTVDSALLQRKPVGHLTSLQQKIMEISGMDTGQEPVDTSLFFD